MLHNAGNKQRKGVQESVFIKHVLKIINQDVSLENLEKLYKRVKDPVKSCSMNVKLKYKHQENLSKSISFFTISSHCCLGDTQP